MTIRVIAIFDNRSCWNAARLGNCTRYLTAGHRSSTCHNGDIAVRAIKSKECSTKGTATAASLWSTGAIGIACAVNAFDVAIIIMVFALLTLIFFSNGKSDTEDTGARGTQ
ncbi:MgtC/SapB family protein [Brucella tritici]|uniref:MgtC/SapB family protein n=1 Tax=Brucella tritici TaxID=94626 RepID=UPI001F3F87E8|nr:MgtC/SapB family protein [Brucella tritici]